MLNVIVYVHSTIENILHETEGTKICFRIKKITYSLSGSKYNFSSTVFHIEHFHVIQFPPFIFSNTILLRIFNFDFSQSLMFQII